MLSACLRLIASILLTLTLGNVLAQLPGSILNGYVLDNTTNTPLPGATVFIKELSQGATTDDKGHYKLDLAPGTYHVKFSFIGYEADSTIVTAGVHTAHTVRLKPASIVINEVTVTAEKADANLTKTETGMIVIQKDDLEKMPYLLGEVDPVRMIQLTPGIHTSGEGSTGFYVRGGAVDQNLMTLDNSTIYNPSHLFGFFSIFNGSTIQDMELYKGGIPAELGGRLSSVTNIHTRKGSAQEFKGEGSIGIIAASVLAEGPIKKNKSSFLVAARRTYVDLFAKALRDLRFLKQDINYYFYDINTNLDFNLSAKDQLRIRGYFGQDVFEYQANNSFDNAMDWRNISGSVTWQHTFHENLYGELVANTSLYDMNFGATINTYVFNIASDIRDKGLSYQLNWQLNKHDISMGAVYTHHTLRPNNFAASSDDVDLEVAPKTQLYAHEIAAYVNDKIEITEALQVNAGIRFTGYSQAGPFTRYLQDDNFQVLDTIQYGRYEPIVYYFNAEPRLSLRYRLNEQSSIKASYDNTHQYMHMAPLSSVSLPLDMWVPSSENIKPQSAHQWSAGYFRNFNGQTIETSVVGYYKTMDHQLEYREGTIIGYSKGLNFDDNFVFGEGKSYGIELSVKKTAGSLTGQVSYTLSKTTRTFPDLNKGKSFDAKYDRLHDLSVMANYEYNRRWTFSGVFVYGTGNALNLPVARYVIQGNIINEYGSRNAFRMPPYHRLDLSVTYAARRSEKFQSYWILSVYNVYSRKNPYYIYFETKGNLEHYELETSIKQVSLFPIIPAITYRIKF